ncbi:Hydrogenase expression/formation protein HupF [Rhodovastum atsumiense]|nr:Hydrogenase expression/formation protein HupF [Rhodovastum atsumiense]
MTVLAVEAGSAVCEHRGERRVVSTLLVGDVTPGMHLLVHIDTAVRVLDAAEARSIEAALDGVQAALDGRDFEPFFADLIGREPELPPFLRAGAK